VVVGRGVSVDPQSLSREELLALVVDQAVLIGQLRAEVAELRRRLDQNSSNSWRPPSSDSPYGRPTASETQVGLLTRCLSHKRGSAPHSGGRPAMGSWHSNSRASTCS
jgi:hypothetical protein